LKTPRVEIAMAFTNGSRLPDAGAEGAGDGSKKTLVANSAEARI
jgi:hypothetical protein